MPWQTPTLDETRRLNRDSIAAALPGADATIPNSVLRVLSDGNAALARLALLYLDWIAKQVLPDTAESEWLDRHGAIWLGGRNVAAFASGTAAVTGLEDTILPQGTPLASSAGLAFETTAQVVVGTTPTPVAIRALDAGAGGNLVAGSPLTITVAVSGVDATATVLELNGGVDTESDDSLRDRVLTHIRQPPHGGAATDYVGWARAVPGVTRAWCAPNEMGVGTVTVRVMMDELRASAGGYPTQADLDAVKAALDQVRPVAVKELFVVSPIPEPIGFRVLKLDDDSTATRNAIKASVRAMLLEKAAPARAVNGMLVPAQAIYREWVSAAILATPGVYSFDLEMDDHPMPTNGSMATLGGNMSFV
jgi:uncharacterized phage protein gp47/JayE